MARKIDFWTLLKMTQEYISSHYAAVLTDKDKLSQLTANIAFAGFTAPKILWLKNREPESFLRIQQSAESKWKKALRYCKNTSPDLKTAILKA